MRIAPQHISYIEARGFLCMQFTVTGEISDVESPLARNELETKFELRLILSASRSKEAI
jgi:hypothetical protein